MTVSQDYYFTNKATAFFSINNHVIFIFCQSEMDSIIIRLLIKNNNELKINWGAWFSSSHSNGCTRSCFDNIVMSAEIDRHIIS